MNIIPLNPKDPTGAPLWTLEIRQNGDDDYAAGLECDTEKVFLTGEGKSTACATLALMLEVADAEARLPINALLALHEVAEEALQALVSEMGAGNVFTDAPLIESLPDVPEDHICECGDPDCISGQGAANMSEVRA